ncbi:hypothetical protein RJT34_30339 [Clitoria ternatea]|uniref:Uncharacterized protein n=1 Tax=Clitoria ternatea TaxID=43366 RepID=A0AAN9ET85_CLITE
MLKQKAEIHEDTCFRDLSRENAKEDVIFIKDALTDNQSAQNSSVLPRVAIEDGSSSEGHIVELSNSHPHCSTSPNFQQNVGNVEKTYNESSVSKKKELLIIGNQMDTEALFSKSEASMFAIGDNNTSTVSKGNSDSRAGDSSSLGAVASIKSCILGEATQVTDNKSPYKQGDHENFCRDVSVIDQESEKAPFDSSLMRCDVDQSHLVETGVNHYEVQGVMPVGSDSVDEKEDSESKIADEARISLELFSLHPLNRKLLLVLLIRN